MLAALRMNWVMLRTNIQERLMYRADFAFGTLMRFLPIVTQIFLWGAIFAIHTDDPHDRLNGYTHANMISYYLLAMLARAFSSMPGLSSGIARDIRDGTIKKYLTQPVDMLLYLFWARTAHKLVYYAVAAGPFALVFYVCRGYFGSAPDAATLAAFGAALVMAFLVGFLLEALVGLVAFWFLEVSSLIFIFMMLNYFLSGHMLPLDWLPDGLRQVVLYLPFQYLAYFPAAILIKGYTQAELVGHLLTGTVWIGVLLVLCRLMFRAGVKRYGAFGG